MKITDIKYEVAWTKQKYPFRIAFATFEYSPAVFIKLTTDAGIVGYGEANPFAPVTGEDENTVVNALKVFTPGIIGADPFDIQGIHAVMDRCLYGNASAKCGIDIALYDIMSKAAGQPLYKFLGSTNNRVVTDVTIGIDVPEKMLERAKDWVSRGFRILKVKTGIDPKDDLEALRLMHEAFGDSVLIRIDGNQGYSAASALAAIPCMAELGVKAFEQPLPAWDIDGMARVRARAGNVQIMADESLHSPHDALRICQAGAADILNIKLMKCGGLYPAQKINAIGEAFGINCMVGCMMDTKVAISAALALVAANTNITEADCDGFLLIDDQGKELRGGFTYEGCDITLSDAPGLGIEIDM